ncbi:lipopolysaccharide biosynthesis protein [Dactylosporangium sp. NPDC005555]|uniref:lipopolysaccharide biosynthesis protein n=1 Tax=Dactylosporangium sp. NPDC005555 TaxID=3154889 RepID=UPI0033A58592
MATTRTTRNRRLVSGVAASFGAVGAGSVASLIVAPVMFHHLGPALFGLWVAVTALTSVALFADLGMGNSLLTRLAAHRAAPSGVRDATGAVAAAYLTLAGTGAVLLAGVMTVGVAVPVGPLFGVTDARLGAQAATVLVVCFGAFAVNLPLSLITKIQLAMQDTARSAGWSAATAAWTVLVVGGAAAAGAGPLTLIACASTAAPVGNLANTVHYFTRVRPDLRPARWVLEPGAAGGLLRLSVRYFALSLLTSTAASIDGYLVARWLGPVAAAHYGVTVRMFILLNLVVTVVNTPLWPANADALARGDLPWVRRTTRRMCLLGAGLVGAAAAVLVAASEPLLAAWIRSPDFHGLPTGVVALLALWPALLAAVSPMFMVQNSVGLLRPQLAGWGAYLLLSLPAKALLVRDLGLAGVPLGSAAVFAVTVLPACAAGYRAVVARKPGHRRRTAGPAPGPAYAPAPTGPGQPARERTCS